MVRTIKRFINRIEMSSKPAIVAVMAVVLLLGALSMAQASGTPLHDIPPGTIINFSGRQWIVLEQMTNGETYILLNEPVCQRAFDPDATFLFDPNDSNNIGYYLNNDFYNSLSQKELIADHYWDIWSWTYGSGSTLYPSVHCKVGLLNVDEYMAKYSSVYGGSILPASFSYRWWLLWPDGESDDRVMCVKAEDGTVRSSQASADHLSVRPVCFLKGGLMIDQTNSVNDGSTPLEIPTGLSAVATSPTTVNLTWQANTEQDLAGYRIYRNNVEIATVGKVTSWTDSTASPGTTYTYELVAYNTSGQDSQRSNPATVTTPSGSGGDNMLHDQEPGTVINFSGREWIILEQMPNGETYLILKEPDCQRGFDPDGTNLFNPDDSNNIAYYLNNNFYNSLSQKELISEHSWDRVSVDYYGNNGTDYGNIICNIGLISYREYEKYSSYYNGDILPSQYSYWWWARSPRSEYTYTAWEVDATGNLGDTNVANTSGSVRPTIYLQAGLALDQNNNVIKGPVGTPPAAPIGLSAVATSPTTVNLTWQANTEQDLAGYKIYRNGVEIETVGKVTSWTDSTVSPSTTYTYELVAYNTSGQDSQRSNPATVTTPHLPLPTALTAIWKGDYIEVSWEAGNIKLGSQVALWRQMDNGPWMAVKTLTPAEKESFVLNDRNVGVGVNCRYEIRECSIASFFRWTAVAESGWAVGDRPMNAPGGVRTASSSDNTAVITWNSVAGASNYIVQYSVAGQPWQTQTVSSTSVSVPRPSKIRVKAEGTYSHWSGVLTVR